MLDRFLGEQIRGALVRNLIQKLKPDLIHVVEFQHAGYVLLRALAKPLPGQRPKIMSSNYGSDIFWFRRFPMHERKISALLSVSDYYTSECARDVALAKELGFIGKSTLIPNTGGVGEGLWLEQQGSANAAGRRLVLIKGYQNKFGQALQGVSSLFRLRILFGNFENLTPRYEFSNQDDTERQVRNLVNEFFNLHVPRPRVENLKVAFHLIGDSHACPKENHQKGLWDEISQCPESDNDAYREELLEFSSLRIVALGAWSHLNHCLIAILAASPKSGHLGQDQSSNKLVNATDD
jgi:hypothetical protein